MVMAGSQTTTTYKMAAMAASVINATEHQSFRHGSLLIFLAGRS